MKFKYQQKGDTLFVVINGKINNNNVMELMRRMRMLLSHDFNEVVFDLTKVPVITGSTIGKFLMFYKNATARGKKMRIKGINESIFSHFQTLRLNALFPVEQ